MNKFIEDNKNWIYGIIVVLVVSISALVIYFTTTKSTNSTTTTKNYVSNVMNIIAGTDINVARNLDTTGVTNSPEPSETPTLNPAEELRNRCWKALKTLIPSDIYSQLWCLGPNQDLKRIMTCVKVKMISKELNNSKQEIDYEDAIKIFENTDFVERLSAIFLVEFLIYFSYFLTIKNENNGTISFSMKNPESVAQNQIKILIWNKKTQKLQFLGMFYNGIKDSLQMVLTSNDNTTLNSGAKILPKKIINYFKDIDIDQEISPIDYGKMVILFNIGSENFNTNCVLCPATNPGNTNP